MQCKGRQLDKVRMKYNMNTKEFIDKLLFDYDLIETDKAENLRISGALLDAVMYHEGKTIPLYHHKTDGGAEYLTDNFVLCPDGNKEGSFDSNYIVRIDGDITKDAELTIK